MSCSKKILPVHLGRRPLGGGKKGEKPRSFRIPKRRGRKERFQIECSIDREMNGSFLGRKPSLWKGKKKADLNVCRYMPKEGKEKKKKSYRKRETVSTHLQFLVPKGATVRRKGNAPSSSSHWRTGRCQKEKTVHFPIKTGRNFVVLRQSFNSQGRGKGGGWPELRG